MDLIDAHRTFHPNAAEYTFFPDALGTFSRINRMLGHRTNLNKFKKTEIISSSVFSKHSDMKLEINYKKEAGKTTHLWRLNRMLVAWSVDIGSVTTRDAMGLPRTEPLCHRYHALHWALAAEKRLPTPSLRSKE